jgi:hypothetical protein
LQAPPTPFYAVAVLAASNGVVIAIVAAGVLFLAWIVSLFLLVVDSISAGGKVLWFVLLTLLAPVAIPLYLWLRQRRREASAAPA